MSFVCCLLLDVTRYYKLISVSLNLSFDDRLCKDTTGTCKISQVFRKVTIQARTPPLVYYNAAMPLSCYFATVLLHGQCNATLPLSCCIAILMLPCHCHTIFSLMLPTSFMLPPHCHAACHCHRTFSLSCYFATVTLLSHRHAAFLLACCFATHAALRLMLLCNSCCSVTVILLCHAIFLRAI